MEAVLLATFPVSQNDLETLAASRAKAVQAYLLQTGKVEASRLFLKEGRRKACAATAAGFICSSSSQQNAKLEYTGFAI